MGSFLVTKKRQLGKDSPVASLGIALLVIVGTYACLAPYRSAEDNLNLKGILLIVIGLAALVGLSLQAALVKKIKPAALWALGLLVSWLLLASVFTGYHKTALLGTTYLHLGTLGLLSCIGLGLFLLRYSEQLMLKLLYASGVALALVSILFNWLNFGYLIRLVGPVYQADALAAYLGACVLLGFVLMRLYPQWRQYLFPGQLLLVTTLSLTVTRAVFVLIIPLSFLLIVQLKFTNKTSTWCWLVLVWFGLLLGIGLVRPSLTAGRLNNISYAESSIGYRYDLQKAALQALPSVPLFGVGGGIAGALACNKLQAAPLQASCRSGRVFGSSHNIFLDRALELGVIGGLSYLLTIVVALYTNLKDRAHLSTERVAFIYVVIFIAAYYLTNVTTPELELLLWLCAARLLVVNTSKAAV